MIDLGKEIIGDAYSSTHHWDLLRDFVDIEDRLAGHEGEAQAARRISEAFEKHDLDNVSTTEFEIPGWWRGSSSLGIERDSQKYTFGAEHQTIALPLTPSGTVDAELVDLGYGRPEDFERGDCDGKIVLVSSETPDDYGRWIHRSEKYGFAVENGAAGFVFYNHIDGCLPPTGNVGNDDGPGEIPAIGASKEVGHRLVRYCDSGSPRATLEISCRNERAHSRNVEGTIGPSTDEEVLVVSHLDGHDISEAARDNAAGTALLSEVARLLTQIEDTLETRVRFIAFGAEEMGLFGSYYWAANNPVDDVKVVLNTDGTGYSRDLSVYTHRFERVGTVFDTIANELSIPIAISDRTKPHSDHWPFLQKGVPSIQVRSKSSDSGRGWVHTHADTIDKIDLRDLRDLAVPLTAATVTLTESDRTVPHKPVTEIRDALIKDGHDVGKRNSGSWPFEPSWKTESDQIDAA